MVFFIIITQIYLERRVYRTIGLPNAYNISTVEICIWIWREYEGALAEI